MRGAGEGPARSDRLVVTSGRDPGNDADGLRSRRGGVSTTLQAVEGAGAPRRLVLPAVAAHAPVLLREAASGRATHGQRVLAAVVPRGHHVGAAVGVEVARGP